MTLFFGTEKPLDTSQHPFLIHTQQELIDASLTWLYVIMSKTHFFLNVETVKQDHSRDATVSTAAVHIVAQASANAIRQEEEMRRVNIEK